MNPILDHLEIVVHCSCGALCYRARFTKHPEWRLVEDAPAGTGRVSLTFPLVEGEPILGTVGRMRTRFRLHEHRAFSADAFTRKRPPPTFEPPTVEPVGNLHDLLNSTCDGGGRK